MGGDEKRLRLPGCTQVPLPGYHCFATGTPGTVGFSGPSIARKLQSPCDSDATSAGGPSHSDWQNSVVRRASCLSSPGKKDTGLKRLPRTDKRINTRLPLPDYTIESQQKTPGATLTAREVLATLFSTGVTVHTYCPYTRADYSLASYVAVIGTKFLFQ